MSVDHDDDDQVGDAVLTTPSQLITTNANHIFSFPVLCQTQKEEETRDEERKLTFNGDQQERKEMRRCVGKNSGKKERKESCTIDKSRLFHEIRNT